VILVFNARGWKHLKGKLDN